MNQTVKLITLTQTQPKFPQLNHGSHPEFHHLGFYYLGLCHPGFFLLSQTQYLSPIYSRTQTETQFLLPHISHGYQFLISTHSYMLIDSHHSFMLQWQNIEHFCLNQKTDEISSLPFQYYGCEYESPPPHLSAVTFLQLSIKVWVKRFSI